MTTASRRGEYTITTDRDRLDRGRFMLSTRDAHGLYAQFGFAELASPSRIMEILNADAYRAPPAPGDGPRDA